MIAHARNRKTPLQRQTAQHVTNRRAELFLGSGGGGNRLFEGEISTGSVKRLQCSRRSICDATGLCRMSSRFSVALRVC